VGARINPKNGRQLEMRIKASLIFAALVLFTLPARAQQNNSEVSVNFTGDFQKSTSGFGVSDSPSYSGGFLANYRYHFNRWSAVEVNYSHTKFSQFYNNGTVTQANVNEATFAYLFTFGISEEARLHPFVEAGTGVLFFSPIAAGTNSGSLSQDRATFLYGGGLTYKLAHKLSLQVGYRGLIYRTPDFTIATQFTNAPTHMAEPYGGLTYRF
jgi:opacity protein-like surface antigen